MVECKALPERDFLFNYLSVSVIDYLEERCAGEVFVGSNSTLSEHFEFRIWLLELLTLETEEKIRGDTTGCDRIGSAQSDSVHSLPSDNCS